MTFRKSNHVSDSKLVQRTITKHFKGSKLKQVFGEKFSAGVIEHSFFTLMIESSLIKDTEYGCIVFDDIHPFLDSSKTFNYLKQSSKGFSDLHVYRFDRCLSDIDR